MYLLKHMYEPGFLNAFQIEVSEDGLLLYEACINYVLMNCSDKQLYNVTGCERDEIRNAQKNIIAVLSRFADAELLPERYYDEENTLADPIELEGLGVVT